MIDMSHSELRSLVVKAARGAGLVWGLCEETGWAAEWLALRGLPAADWAALWLANLPAGGANPVEFGLRLAEGVATGQPLPPTLPDNLPAPGFLLPFLHRIALTLGPIEVSSGTGRAALVSPEGEVTFGPGWGSPVAGWSVERLSARPDPGRVVIRPPVVERLDALALRTTVPPSDASRRNAGSEQSDND